MKEGTQNLLLLLLGLGLVIFSIFGLLTADNAEVSIVETKDDSSGLILIIGILLCIGAVIRIMRERRIK